MAHESIPTTEPTELTSGMSWAWDRVVAGHSPVDGWILRYSIQGKRHQTFDASPNGDTFEVRLAPSETELFPGGRGYRLAGVVEREDVDGTVTERHPVYDGQLAIRQNPLEIVGEGTRAEQMLEAVEAVLEGRATSDHESIRINNREITRIPISELRKLRRDLRIDVAAERGQDALFGRYEVHFAAP